MTSESFPLDSPEPAQGLERGANRNRTGGAFRLRVWLLCLGVCVCFWLLIVLGTIRVAEARCRTHKCWHRVSVRRHEDWAWRHYRAHPMPYCTWAYESGTWGSPWRPSRYRAKNPSSTAGGKFQILDRTWYAFGGSYQGRVSHPAAYASALEQERIARRVLAGQGLGAWVGC